MGHKPLEESCCIQVRRQCCTQLDTNNSDFDREAVPYGKNVHICQSLQTTISATPKPLVMGTGAIHSVQSSPGYLHVGHVPSNCTRQMPQTSSSGMSHRHEATACHSSIVTFMMLVVDLLEEVGCRALYGMLKLDQDGVLAMEFLYW